MRKPNGSNLWRQARYSGCRRPKEWLPEERSAGWEPGTANAWETEKTRTADGAAVKRKGLSLLGMREKLKWEGEAPAEPQYELCVRTQSRLGGSLALPFHTPT